VITAESSVEKGTIDVINPVTGDKITTVSGGSSKDVDVAAEAAKKAYKTSWGAKVPGAQRGAAKQPHPSSV